MNHRVSMALHPTEGDSAPGFSLPDQDSVARTLAGYLGSFLILYFYPKDNTTGCTAEALAFTAFYEKLRDAGVPVVGISPDSVASHRKFIDKHDLKLVLLSDPDHQAIEVYGAWTLKKMYGREYYGVERSTFLISPDGIITAVWHKVKVKGHAEDVLARLKEITGE
jgi:thioredoxin-dependent peroxiredoxin